MRCGLTLWPTRATNFKDGVVARRTGSDSLATELQRLSAEGMAPSHLALLLEVAAAAAEARSEGSASADLVWTGPEASASRSRDTSVVVEELFQTPNVKSLSAVSLFDKVRPSSSHWRLGWDKFRI